MKNNEKFINEHINTLNTEQDKQNLSDILGLYFKGEIYNNDPINLITYLASLELPISDYEKMLPDLEKTCFKNVNLLEQYQLLLRGDCLPKEYIDNPPESVVTGAVRNRCIDFKNEDARKKMVFLLMINLCARVNIAYHYEYKNQTQNIKAIPCLMYGFRKFSQNEIETSENEPIEEGCEDYLYGSCDDIGEAFLNIHFIKLPNPSKFDSSRESNNKRIILPYSSIRNLNPSYQTSSNDRKRVKNIEKSFGRELYSDEWIHVDYQLTNIRTYFNLLLMLNKVLSDIEIYDKSQKDNKVHNFKN